jgi:4'-phosphopantetheinyl transferase
VENIVQLWQTDLDQAEPAVKYWRSLLSADECQRADRYLRERDRLHFTVARGQVRSHLGRLLNVPATAIAFDYTKRGKPSVVQSNLDGARLEFNVSHSEGMALYVVAWDRRVGVDLEYLRPMADAAQLVKRFYTAAEAVEFFQLPESDRTAAFFQAWTAKEAYLKATGEGVSHLRDVEFSLNPQHPLELRRIFSPVEVIENWSVRSLSVKAGWLAAIAVEGKDWQLVQQTENLSPETLS